MNKNFNKEKKYLFLNHKSYAPTYNRNICQYCLKVFEIFTLAFVESADLSWQKPSYLGRSIICF